MKSMGSCAKVSLYNKNIGRAASLAVAHPDAAERIFNATDGGYHTLNEIIKSICTALGRRPPRLSLPVGSIRIVVRLIEKVAKTFGIKASVTQETVDKYTEDIAVDGSLIQRELGLIPQYDLMAGWEETVRKMQT